MPAREEALPGDRPSGAGSVRPLWLLLLVAGGLGLLSLAVPHDPDTDDVALLVTSLAALAIGGGAWLARRRLGRRSVNALLATCTVLATVAIFTTGGPPNASSALFFWICLYAAYVMPLRIAMVHATLCALAYGLTCLLQPPDFPPYAHWTTTVGSLLGATALVGALRQRLSTTIAELEAAVRTDSLTGLANRRAFTEHLDRELARTARSGLPVALLACDVDHFKAVNDRFGHPVGDEVLREVADVLRAQSRSIDLVARTGGEELCVVLPDTDLDEAVLAAERLRREVARRTARAGRPVTISIGAAAAARGGPDAAEDLLRRADRALYRAKASGRDRVEAAGALRAA